MMVRIPVIKLVALLLCVARRGKIGLVYGKPPAMTSFVRDSNDPSNPARFQHLAERMFGICEQRGWKHDPVPEGERLFAFWPWGPERPPVHAAAAILETGAGKLEEQVGLVLLGVRWHVPAPLVDTRLLELLDMCARYGVCLTVGERHPDPERASPSVEVVLTRAIAQRILNAAAVDDAPKLLSVAQFELGEFCRQIVG